MRNVFILSTVLFVLIGCTDIKQSEPVVVETKKPVDTLPYYDARMALTVELDYIKSSKKLQVYKLTESDGTKDSVAIDTIELNRLAGPFLELDLNQPAIKKLYRETTFEDNDTKSYVFNYTTESEALPVKSVSIMVDNKYQDFKRMDQMRSYSRNDTTFEERLSWVAGTKFQVVQIIAAGGKEQVKQTQVLWRKNK